MRRFLAQPWGPFYTVGESLMFFLIGAGAIALTFGTLVAGA